MQQLFDTQLLWFGQMDEKTPTPAVGKSNPAWDTTALSLWGKAHDDWLAMTQRWIASADPAASRGRRSQGQTRGGRWRGEDQRHSRAHLRPGRGTRRLIAPRASLLLLVWDIGGRHSRTR